MRQHLLPCPTAHAVSVPTCALPGYVQGGWAFLDLEKSDGEDEEEEPSSEGFDPGSDAEEEAESSEDYSDEVNGACCVGMRFMPGVGAAVK